MVFPTSLSSSISVPLYSINSTTALMVPGHSCIDKFHFAANLRSRKLDFDGMELPTRRGVALYWDYMTSIMNLILLIICFGHCVPRFNMQCLMQRIIQYYFQFVDILEPVCRVLPCSVAILIFLPVFYVQAKLLR